MRVLVAETCILHYFIEELSQCKSIEYFYIASIGYFYIVSIGI